VTEHEKYALAATKPGGYASAGLAAGGGAAGPTGGGGAGGEGEASGLEFLSERPPWRCSVCNVGCTSRETLLGHAAGAKHKRRVRLRGAVEEGGGGVRRGAGPRLPTASRRPLTTPTLARPTR
jgi:cell growth-regulating nucleolar protein